MFVSFQGGRGKLPRNFRIFPRFCRGNLRIQTRFGAWSFAGAPESDLGRRRSGPALENLCRNFPDNRFLVSVLSRENQHELCVYARKFSNLMPFGCWWFLNNPSVVEEMTRERIEMLGMSFIPQHSDARVLEQVIYKWRNTRRTLAPILANSYKLLLEDGGSVSRERIRQDIQRLFRGNFQKFCRLQGAVPS